MVRAARLLAFSLAVNACMHGIARADEALYRFHSPEELGKLAALERVRVDRRAEGALITYQAPPTLEHLYARVEEARPSGRSAFAIYDSQGKRLFGDDSTQSAAWGMRAAGGSATFFFVETPEPARTGAPTLGRIDYEYAMVELGGPAPRAWFCTLDRERLASAAPAELLARPAKGDSPNPVPGRIAKMLAEQGADRRADRCMEYRI